MNIRFEGHGDDALENGREGKGPCPAGIGYVHPGRATDGRRQRGGEALAVVVAPRLRVERRLRGVLWLIRRVGGVVAIEGLTSQERRSCLVWRNFGRSGSREGRLNGWICRVWGMRRVADRVRRAARCLGRGRAGGTAATVRGVWGGLKPASRRARGGMGGA